MLSQDRSMRLFWHNWLDSIEWLLMALTVGFEFVSLCGADSKE